MKKEDLRARIRALDRDLGQHREDLEQHREDLAEHRRRIKALDEQIDNFKTNWRPVPMVHEWQPVNPQCALCDEPRDAARHQVGG